MWFGVENPGYKSIEMTAWIICFDLFGPFWRVMTAIQTHDDGISTTTFVVSISLADISSFSKHAHFTLEE
jgi:hypothetical protein